MPDVKNLLREAAEEIRHLRHRLEIAEAKVNTMEIFGAALFSHAAGGSFIAGVDIACKIDDELGKILGQEAAAAVRSGPAAREAENSPYDAAARPKPVPAPRAAWDEEGRDPAA